MERLINKKTAFHIHTKYSYDSNLDPKGIIENLVNWGYEQVIITDHDTIDGALYAKEYAEKNYKNQIHVIIGEEISTNIGDIIGFPLKHHIETNDFNECILKIKEQNAFVCLPHPYKEHNLFEIHTNEFIEKIDFIETFNARLNPTLNGFAEKYADYYNKFKIIGSDTHVCQELNNTCFKFLNSNHDIDILKSIYSKKSHIRKSQLIKYQRRKNVSKVIKYFILEKLNK